jgi:MFS family permease
VAVYAVHLGASPFVLGLLVALFSFAPSLLTVSLGKLIDRIGTRLPMQVSYVAMCLTGLMLYLWPQQQLLYVMASIIGIGFFGVFVSVNTLINHYSTPQTRAANFSLMSTGIAVAQGIAPLILGFCADHVGWAEAFGVIALFPLLSWAVFAWSGVPHLGPGSQAAAQKARQGGTLAMLRDPRMRPVFVISTLFILGWDIFLVLTPIYGTQLGLSASQMGMIMSAYAIASFLVRFLGGTLARFYSPWQILLTALGVAAVGTFAFGMVSSMPLLMLFAFIMGLGQGVGSPMATTALYEVAPEGRSGEALGLRLSLGMAAQTVLPLIVGSLGALFPAAPIFWASGMMLLGGAWMERRQWQPRKRD